MEQDLRRTWDEELRSRGYRVTPQRQLVLEAVAKLDHATPEEIAASVQARASGVNISTVYRTLELLDNLGLVRHTHLNHGAPIYHLASEADHVHLVCQDCGRVLQVSPDAIRPLITALDEGHGFETDVAHLTVFGRCRECRSDPGGRDHRHKVAEASRTDPGGRDREHNVAEGSRDDPGSSDHGHNVAEGSRGVRGVAPPGEQDKSNA